ncbi:ADP-heptose synthase [Paenibacillus koleovorans]|uniref:ADP-heptose synthase n=1 Tax=Paenibacillus koleovorans TaxID=121608 RepID=UPI000FD76F21|nr:ADP-heptose synthase [Paenibacillus koleovorans]
MKKRFVIEAVMLATYGELMVPDVPVEFVIPHSTILELYEMRDSAEPVMPEPEDDAHVKRKIGELIAFFETPFNKIKIERALLAPWRSSPSLLMNDQVSVVVLYAVDSAQYGELFDPIETELLLSCMREKAPILTDQLEFLDKVIESDVPVQVFDVDDFEFALEDDLHPDDWSKL